MYRWSSETLLDTNQQIPNPCANQQAIANRLPDYTYSVPGMLGYFLDPGHTAGGYRLHERCYFDQKDLEVDIQGKVMC